MSPPKISNPVTLAHLISEVSTTACVHRHRGLITLQTPPGGALGTFAATHELAYIGSRDAADRADRITEVLGCEFDILIHETRDDVDAGLLAALAGTVKAGGVLVLGLPFSLDPNMANSDDSRFNQRFAQLLSDSLLLFPGKILWLRHLSGSNDIGQETTFVQTSLPRGILPASKDTTPPSVIALRHQATAEQEQKSLLHSACAYLEDHPQGCMTITGRRGRGKSSLLGQIASWLNEQDITFAVTTARQSALTSLHRHSSGQCDFIAPADAYQSGCQVLLVDEASSLPLSLLESFLETHTHVIFCSTVEGYENAGRAFALRFSQMLRKRYAHALTLQPKAPWRWDEGDPLEHLIDTLLMGGNAETDCTPLPVPERNLETSQVHSDTDTGSALSDCQIRLLDRSALALDEPLLRQVYGLLRDTHYQTSAADLSHLLDAPHLQLWVLEGSGRIKAALLLVLEGKIDTELHAAIVSKQRRLPHQLLPQLLAQTANDVSALTLTVGRIIRIAVTCSDRRRGLGSKLLQALEGATTASVEQVSGFGASFASDTVNIAFWQKNGYTRFHTGFKSNPRTGTPAVAVMKSKVPALESVLQLAVTIHDDNSRWLSNLTGETAYQPMDAELLQKFAIGQRSVHDTFAALSRLAQLHNLPLQHDAATPRRRYEAVLREAVSSLLERSG